MDDLYNKLEIVLKVSEDCNLGCDYCYFFHEPDKLYLKHPKKISITSVDDLVFFLVGAIEEYRIKNIQIDFHGGEPLLIGKKYFSKICDILKNGLTNRCNLTFALQTNATLIDKEWCDIFSKYNFAVGASLDGPAEINNLNRKYKNKKGAYSNAIKGLLQLQKTQKDELGILTVINPSVDPKLIFNHFVKDLNIKRMDFLLPDYIFDYRALVDDELFFIYLKTLFDEWLKLDDPNIRIRFLESIVSLLMGGQSLVSGTGTEPIFTITIASDGTIFPDDSLRSCGSKVFNSNYNIKKNTLKEFLDSENMFLIDNALKELPVICRKCDWKMVCNGGHLVNRWSNVNYFNNPTIFCKVMYNLIEYINKEIKKYK